MPFYDLRCEKCGTEFNASATISDKTEKRVPCPDCGSFDLETVYKSAPAYIKSTRDGDCPNRHVCGSGCRHGR